MTASRKKKHGQGTPLPLDGSRLLAYPVGCCVQVDDVWYIVAYRIGQEGGPYLSQLRHPPTSPEWNQRDDRAMYFSEQTIVDTSCWPKRQRDEVIEDVVDPMLDNLRLDGSVDPAVSMYRSRGSG